MKKQKKKSRHSKQTHNRQYKDRLWRMIFNNKEDLLQLYNAINHTDYHNPDDLEVNTLEDVKVVGRLHEQWNKGHRKDFRGKYPLPQFHCRENAKIVL